MNAAYETTLNQGVVFERRLFHSTFATVRAAMPASCGLSRSYAIVRVQNDQKEGMKSFAEKRKPAFTDS